MENNPSVNNLNQNSQSDNFQKKTKPHLVLILLVLGVVIVFVLLAYVLFTKSKNNPNLNIKKISIFCPSTWAFCKNKNEVYEKGKAIGIGDLLKTGTPIYAVVDGEVVVRSVSVKVNGKIEHYRKITLKSSNKDLTAEYFFEKGKVKNSIVKKGDIIFVIESDDPISYYQKYNFVIKLFDRKLNPILTNEINFL